MSAPLVINSTFEKKVVHTMFINFWKFFQGAILSFEHQFVKGVPFIYIYFGKGALMLIPRNTSIPDDRLRLLT